MSKQELDAALPRIDKETLRSQDSPMAALFHPRFPDYERRLSDVKNKVRVLFIDDEDRKRLISYLGSEGWNCRQLFDLDRLENMDLRDSHIVFVDILGVGAALSKENHGLDLVVSIKARYPQKKVAIYSSKETHSIFHQANDLIDKRILKRGGDFEVFLSAVEELSRHCFEWTFVVDEIYDRVRDELDPSIDRGRFRVLLERAISRPGHLSQRKFQRLLRVGKTAYDLAMPVIALFFSV